MWHVRETYLPTGFWWKYLLGVDRRVMLKWMFKKWGGEAWPGVVAAQDRDRWRAVVIGVMNFRVP